jgi:hypothetical protein
MKKPLLSNVNEYKEGLNSDTNNINYFYTYWYFVHTIPLPYVRDIQELENNFEECGIYFNMDWSRQGDANRLNAQGKNWSK